VFPTVSVCPESQPLGHHSFLVPEGHTVYSFLHTRSILSHSDDDRQDGAVLSRLVSEGLKVEDEFAAKGALPEVAVSGGDKGVVSQVRRACHDDECWAQFLC
jgi:hypothetical protein